MEDHSNTLANFDPFSVPPTTSTPKRVRAPKSSNTDPIRAAERREKARERQRRKRERDRLTGLGVLVQPDQQPSANSSMVTNPSIELSPEELARRDRVRAAARERQRKHRALMKQRKMAELGLAMGNETMGLEEAHYALQTDGQYQQILPPQSIHELGQETPLPQGHTGGQTFASTLLLSFSCSPLLKQHLLRTLHMTNEELASLEPVLSLAWDQWDHARRLHYAEQAAKVGVQEQNGLSEPHPYGPQGMTSPAYDFRARFHRPLTAPSPFRAIPDSLQQATSSATSSEQPNEVIDPSLSNPKEDVEGSGSDAEMKEQERDEEEVAINVNLEHE